MLSKVIFNFLLITSLGSVMTGCVTEGQGDGDGASDLTPETQQELRYRAYHVGRGFVRATPSKQPLVMTRNGA